jgi:hypothetical protein
MNIDTIDHLADRLLEAAEAQSAAIRDLQQFCNDYIKEYGEV